MLKKYFYRAFGFLLTFFVFQYTTADDIQWDPKICDEKIGNIIFSGKNTLKDDARTYQFRPDTNRCEGRYPIQFSLKKKDISLISFISRKPPTASYSLTKFIQIGWPEINKNIISSRVAPQLSLRAEGMVYDNIYRMDTQQAIEARIYNWKTDILYRLKTDAPSFKYMGISSWLLELDKNTPLYIPVSVIVPEKHDAQTVKQKAIPYTIKKKTAFSLYLRTAKRFTKVDEVSICTNSSSVICISDDELSYNKEEIMESVQIDIHTFPLPGIYNALIVLTNERGHRGKKLFSLYYGGE